MKDGRPLRFLGGSLGGWMLFRVAALWPGADPAPLRAFVHAVLPPVAALALPQTGPQMAPAAAAKPATVHDAAPTGARDPAAAAPPRLPIAPSPPTRNAPSPRADPIGIIGPPLRPTPIARGPGRLGGSAWLLARGWPNGTLSGGQLGASQAGVRVTYALGTGRRVALTARIATPLAGRGKEGAIGIEWKPTRLPFRLIAEQRVVLDGGRGGPTVGMIGGYGPGLVAPGVRIEAYGQAGVIARDGIEGFVDTAARVTHPVPDHGVARVDFGIGIWGSAQRGAARLDLGPTIGVAVPVAKRAIRLSIDWRERVAGNARPGSGPALSIGSDF